MGETTLKDQHPMVYVMKCPECMGKLHSSGFMGSGHTIYNCKKCGKVWEIKKQDPPDWEEP